MLTKQPACRLLGLRKTLLLARQRARSHLFALKLTTQRRGIPAKKGRLRSSANFIHQVTASPAATGRPSTDRGTRSGSAREPPQAVSVPTSLAPTRRMLDGTRGMPEGLIGLAPQARVLSCLGWGGAEDVDYSFHSPNDTTVSIAGSHVWVHVLQLPRAGQATHTPACFRWTRRLAIVGKHVLQLCTPHHSYIY